MDLSTPKAKSSEHVVNCGGLWARSWRDDGDTSAGSTDGTSLSDHRRYHRNSVAHIKRGEAGRLPAGIDYEANIYFRQERHGMLLGTYEPQSTPWKVEGTPWDFGHEPLNPDLDRIMTRLEMSYDRIPAIGNVGIKYHQWAVYLWTGWQSNDWAGARDEKLLGCGWRYGRVLPGRWGWPDLGGMDD